jgi:hypothetical protein
MDEGVRRLRSQVARFTQGRPSTAVRYPAAFPVAGNDRHPERAELPGQPGAVVIRPHRGRRQLRMKLPADLGLGE